MKQSILTMFALFFATINFAQNKLQFIIQDQETQQPIENASVKIPALEVRSTTNPKGLVDLNNLPEGTHSIVFAASKYVTKTQTFIIPYTDSQPIVIALQTIANEEEHEHEEEHGHQLEEVIITSTRSKRTIYNTPTRIEAISGEELEEKGNMKPGDIRMLLNESTGIQTQQTSATSYNSSIRIQGLDGKYTQILRDGFPLYAGFSGGLSLMQIAPLDLKQVEVIKGASSTLYGGGAIAGLVNLVTKKPTDEQEVSFMLNGTSALGLDASVFYSEKFDNIGATLFASYNLGTPYDPADIGLTAIPEFRRFTLNPRLFIDFNDKTSLNVGVNSVLEERIGGDIDFITGETNDSGRFFEKNITDRLSTQLAAEHKVSDNQIFNFKNSISFYDRSIEIPDYKFAGNQLSSFTEANYTYKGEVTEWILGVNLWTDKFTQEQIGNAPVVDYNHITPGIFVQNTWDINDMFTLETGLRGDYQNEYGFFALPRFSGLYKVNPKLSMRLGGGLGYKTPTVFTEDAERLQFRNVLPIDVPNTKAERSLGANFDVNYKTPLTEQLSFTINTLFFYTQIQDPLVLVPLTNNVFEFQQPNGFIDTKGIETNIKLKYKDFALFVGYTLADVNEHYNDRSTTFPLVSKHRLNNVLMYEVEGKLKMGLEAYYFSPQQLNDGTTGRDYWLFGFMVEKLWNNFSVFINFENFGDTRQTNFDTIFTGSLSNPVFRDIYAPVDGFVVNGGFKIRL